MVLKRLKSKSLMLWESGGWLMALMKNPLPESFFSQWLKISLQQMASSYQQTAEGLSRWLEQMVNVYDIASALLESMIDDDRD